MSPSSSVPGVLIKRENLHTDVHAQRAPRRHREPLTSPEVRTEAGHRVCLTALVGIQPCPRLDLGLQPSAQFLMHQFVLFGDGSPRRGMQVETLYLSPKGPLLHVQPSALIL